MSANSARPNTPTVVTGDLPILLSYAPQVNPSPLTVGSGKGSLEVVITNATAADVDVLHVGFTIQVAPDDSHDGNALTSTTANVNAVASDSSWHVEKPTRTVENGPATYTLKHATNDYGTIRKGGSVVVQIYGFPINGTAGTSAVQILEATGRDKFHPKVGNAHFTVTTFPWGFAFSDLAASVPEGDAWRPVAQVENGSTVTLHWHGSVVETDSYTIYYSSAQGEQKATPGKPDEWTSQPLTSDTVFTLAVKTDNSVDEPLSASMSVAVAVRNADVVAKSVTAQTGTLDAVAAGKEGWGAASPLALVARGDSACSARVFVGDTTNTQKTGKRIPTKGLVLDGAYTWPPLRPAPRLRLIENIDSTKEPNTQRHWNIDAMDGLMRFFVEPGYDQSGPGLGSFDKDGNFYVQKSVTINNYSYGYNTGEKCVAINTNNGLFSIDGTGTLNCPANVYVQGNLCQYTAGQWRQLYYGYYKEYAGYQNAALPSDLRLKSEVQPVPSALAKVRQLQGITFRWNEDGLHHLTRDVDATVSAGPNATEREHLEVREAERNRRRQQLAATHLGVVAQDVEAVLPEAVTTDSDGYKAVRYDNLIPLLIEAIKEQDERAARQQAEIERLKRALGMGA